MRIPLDYYRILGLSIQATDTQLSQAYHDRALQLPRREYSNGAITARKKLLDQAYEVLSQPKERHAYDEEFLSKSYDKSTKPRVDLPLQQAGAIGEINLDAHTPWIEIEPEQFVGALLILQELGEYEQVIKLAQPYLDNRSVISLDKGRFGDPQMVRADMVLTIALSYLELAREQWQQGQYEQAALSGQKGKELLLKEGLFASLGGELQTDLYKLRPYRILELLSLSEEQLPQRQKGMQLLKEMLQERNGIDGTGDDHSGLSIDDFLRFIQQLRSYLTCVEQQELFEAEARRPSAVAIYLAVYALLARGFAKKQPALISRAREYLKKLVQRQDVYLELAVSCLLLGLTEEASQALARSQEQDTLAFIHQHSEGDPELLPGLCLYAERWLQTEVFSRCRDLVGAQLSLREYFADVEVQKYLENMTPDPVSENEWQIKGGAEQNVVFATQPPPSVTEVQDQTSPKTSSLQPPPSSIATVRQNSQVSTGALAPVPTPSPRQSPQPTTPSKSTSPRSARKEKKAPRSPRHLSLFKGKKGKNQKLIQWGIGGSLALILLGLIYKIVQSIIFPDYYREPVMITLNKSVVPIPSPDTVMPEDNTKLDNSKAQEVIQKWLDAKKAAFGRDYQEDQLGQILLEPLLSIQKNRVASLKRSGGYYQYEHQIEVISLQEDENDPLKVNVTAKVREVAQYYEGGTNLTNRSYTDDLTVQYDLMSKDDQWFIQDIKVK